MDTDEATVVRHHCGDITTDIVCPHCSEWLDVQVRHIDETRSPA